MIRTFKYKLGLRQQDRVAVEQTLQICQNLYNSALEQRKLHHKQSKSWGLKNPTNRFAQNHQLIELKQQLPEYQTANSQVLQDVVHRLDKTYQNFFRRCQAGLGKGFPRFKSKDRYGSFTHPQFSEKWIDWQNSLVRFPGLGWLRFWQQRPTAAKRLAASQLGLPTPYDLEQHLKEGARVKTSTIIRESDDYYICLAVEFPESARIAKPSLSDLTKLRTVGIDLGLKELVTTNTGQVFGNLKQIKQAELKIRLTQKRLSRKKKGSVRRAKQRDVLRKQHTRLQRTKKQELHKSSRHLIDNYDVICVEDLNIQGMLSKGPSAKPSPSKMQLTPAAQRGLRRNIGLAGWGELVRQISYKAESAGRYCISVDPKGTTQQCSGCGGFPPKPIGLGVRIYSCSHCGMVKNRDENAGMNILLKGLQILSQKNEVSQFRETKQPGCISPTLEKGAEPYGFSPQNSKDAGQQCEAVSFSENSH